MPKCCLQLYSTANFRLSSFEVFAPTIYYMQLLYFYKQLEIILCHGRGQMQMLKKKSQQWNCIVSITTVNFLHTFTYSKWFCSSVWPVLDKRADITLPQGTSSTTAVLDAFTSIHSFSVLQMDRQNFPTSSFLSEYVVNDSSKRTGCKSSATAKTTH